ncbi:MAG: hypothetical protein INR73_17645 [Williamsia sp.]|nr:hypothetical protein [Williamsia sp.]
MPLTDSCDVLGAIHENGLNRIFFHIRSQRPSLFNYGTSTFASDPAKLCCPPDYIHPEVRKRGNPVVTQMAPLPVPGYEGGFGLEYNFSIVNLAVDFEPSNQFVLPKELHPPLKPQSVAFRGGVCGGIACPDKEILEKFIVPSAPYRPDGNTDGSKTNTGTIAVPPQSQLKELQGLPFQKVHCFKLDLFVVVNFARDTFQEEPVLSIKLQNLELVDLKPAGMENSIECFIRTILMLSLFPKLRIAVNALTFNIQNIISIQPTPISAQVPFNPSVGNDALTVRLTLTTPA